MQEVTDLIERRSIVVAQMGIKRLTETSLVLVCFFTLVFQLTVMPGITTDTGLSLIGRVQIFTLFSIISSYMFEKNTCFRVHILNDKLVFVFLLHNVKMDISRLQNLYLCSYKLSTRKYFRFSSSELIAEFDENEVDNLNLIRSDFESRHVPECTELSKFPLMPIFFLLAVTNFIILVLYSL